MPSRKSRFVVTCNSWLHTGFRPIAANRGLAANIRVAAWRRPRIVPKSSAVDAEATCLFFLPAFDILLLLLLAEVDLLTLVLQSDKKISYFKLKWENTNFQCIHFSLLTIQLFHIYILLGSLSLVYLYKTDL